MEKTENIYTDKKELRRRMLLKRSGMDEKECRELGEAIYRRVLESEEYRRSRTILCYASCRKEADTFGIIEDALQSGKKVALPKVTGPADMIFLKIESVNDLIPGYMGIPEPKENCREEIKEGLMFVPGTAFDRELHRMGYGGGYYDRWLKKYGMLVTACGLAYDFQLLLSIPSEPHDRSMNMIITPTMILRKKDKEYDN